MPLRSTNFGHLQVAADLDRFMGRDRDEQQPQRNFDTDELIREKGRING